MEPDDPRNLRLYVNGEERTLGAIDYTSGQINIQFDLSKMTFDENDMIEVQYSCEPDDAVSVLAKLAETLGFEVAP